MQAAQSTEGRREAGGADVEPRRDGRPRALGGTIVPALQLEPVRRDRTPAVGRDPIAKRLARRAEAPAMSPAITPAPPAPAAAAPSVAPALRPSASVTSARTLFRIRFASGMSDERAEPLRSRLLEAAAQPEAITTRELTDALAAVPSPDRAQSR